MARVLIVDDDEDIRDTTALRLRMLGHDVVAVDDAATARDAGARFDVAVVDIHMPGTDGITLLHQLRAQPGTAGLPIIFYTAHWSASVAAEAAPLADVYLTKNQPMSRLVQAIDELAGRPG
ncbi:response regulator [Actinoplanes sp. NPDC026670]|uniref:response regulator n=1 Tax=Actinoplanes sp. NPDC026670 TaxID=3154700 RepID=UPI0033FB3204